MIDKEGASYRSIFKALSLFGGVQIIVILSGIVRTKVIALSLGPEGVGTIGLYVTAFTLFFSIFNLGISSSSVKIISENYFSGKQILFDKSIFVLNKLTLITALTGFFTVCVFSQLLSKWTFGNNENTWSFIVLSFVILSESLNVRNLAVLQGLRRLKTLGKVSIYGSLFGTIISLPLYILFKERAIIPSLLVLYFSNALLSHYYTKKECLPTSKYTYEESRLLIKDFVTLGIAMTISSILVYSVSYVVRLYLAGEGGMKEVGLYQAGWTIATGYVGLIFTAMGKDYFPRLSAVNKDDIKVSKIANQQIEIGLLIISPIIMVFLIFINQIIGFLYSSEFLLIKNMLLWSLIGMFFKLVSWSISFIFLAKGLSRPFIIYEILGNLFTLVVSVLGYKYWGLEGLGLAFLLTNLFYLIMVYSFSFIVFKFKCSRESIRLFVLNTSICLFSVFLIRIDLKAPVYVVYSLLIISLLIVIVHSIYGFERKLGVVQLLKSKIKRT